MTAAHVDYQHLARQDAEDAHLYDARDPLWMPGWFGPDARTMLGVHHCSLCFLPLDHPGECERCMDLIEYPVPGYEDFSREVGF